MKRGTVLYQWGIIFGICLSISGCSYLRTEKASADSAPHGIRIYPQSVYLFVDEAKNETQVRTLPDLANGYDVNPITVLSKQDFQMDIDVASGNVSKVIANQDATAFLKFLEKAAELGAKAGGVPVAAESFEGTFGLKTGIYVVTTKGTLNKISDKVS